MRVDSKDINAALGAAGVKFQCEVCGNGQFGLGEEVFEVREFHGGGMVVGGNAATLVCLAATCTKCGNTKFLNVNALGLQSKVK